MSETIKQLTIDLPEDAIQRTSKSETKKGYDTTGYSYQYCVDRFNDVCGEKWGYSFEILNVRDGQYNSGTPFYDICVSVSIWVNDPNNSRICVGGHISINYADALKGAITNGFKKTAAFWGVGAKAYRGEIDDDNKPLPDHHENIKTIKSLTNESKGKPHGNIGKAIEGMGRQNNEKSLQYYATWLGNNYEWNDDEKTKIEQKYHELKSKFLICPDGSGLPL